MQELEYNQYLKSDNLYNHLVLGVIPDGTIIQITPKHSRKATTRAFIVANKKLAHITTPLEPVNGYEDLAPENIVGDLRVCFPENATEENSPEEKITAATQQVFRHLITRYPDTIPALSNEGKILEEIRNLFTQHCYIVDTYGTCITNENKIQDLTEILTTNGKLIVATMALDIHRKPPLNRNIAVYLIYQAHNHSINITPKRSVLPVEGKTPHEVAADISEHLHLPVVMEEVVFPLTPATVSTLINNPRELEYNSRGIPTLREDLLEHFREHNPALFHLYKHGNPLGGYNIMEHVTGMNQLFSTEDNPQHHIVDEDFTIRAFIPVLQDQ